MLKATSKKGSFFFIKKNKKLKTKVNCHTYVIWTLSLTTSNKIKMKKNVLKKILIVSGSVFLLLATVLAVHIYLVTRPKPVDPSLFAMARIDFKQEINQEDAVKITNWFNKQEIGRAHV